MEFSTSNDVASSPAVVNGVVYIGSGDGNVYALNAYGGTQIWSYITGSNAFSIPVNWVMSSPAVVDGVVYVGCDDGNIYALNATDGDKLWN